MLGNQWVKLITVILLIIPMSYYAEPAVDEHLFDIKAHHNDFWQHLIAEFKWRPPKINAEIAKYRKIYIDNKKSLYNILARARPYLHLILEEIHQQNMPAELIMLPFLESHYDPFAYSKAHAAGIWQIVPIAAQDWGINSNWWYDGRRDLIDSTHFALQYLNKLNKKFHGDWLLTIAAYNSGPKNVLSAIHNNRAQHYSTQVWDLDLPLETQNYVPKMLALLDVIKNHEKYNVPLPPLPDLPLVTQIELPSQVDLSLAAKLADISLATIYQLNPGYNRWATGMHGPYHLLLPATSAELFVQNIEALPPEKRVSFKLHTVQEKETLSHIALQYNTSIEAIKNLNKLDKNVKVGSTLLVPTAFDDVTSYRSSVQEQQIIKDAKISHLAKETYKVKAGDSLWKIAKQYNTTAAELAKWNNINADSVLKLNQELTVWNRNALPKNREILKKINYQVKNGESLHSLANKFNLKPQQIMAWNDVKKSRNLKPGETLTLFINIMDLA